MVSEKYPPHEEGLGGYDFFLKMGFSVEHYINCNVQGENGALRSVLLLDYNAGQLL
jgi:hypothetical protein